MLLLLYEQHTRLKCLEYYYYYKLKETIIHTSCICLVLFCLVNNHSTVTPTHSIIKLLN